MKDRIKIKLIGTIAVILCSCSLLLANPFPRNAWEYLGAKNIGHGLDKDVMYVEDVRTLYTAIELRTDRKQINLHRCIIYFQNGDQQEVRLREDRRGSESHQIDLKGGARAIDKIAIWGSRDYGRIFKAFDKGTVEIWGKVSNRRNRADDTQYYSSRYDDYYRNNDRRWNDNSEERYNTRRYDDSRRDRRNADRRRAERRDDRRRDDRRRRSRICP